MIFLMLFLNSTFSYGEEQLVMTHLLIEGDSIENTLDQKTKSFRKCSFKKDMVKLLMLDLIEYDQVSDELYAIGNVSIEGGGVYI